VSEEDLFELLRRLGFTGEHPINLDCRLDAHAPDRLPGCDHHDLGGQGGVDPLRHFGSEERRSGLHSPGDTGLLGHLSASERRKFG